MIPSTITHLLTSARKVSYLLAFGTVASFSASHVRAQYADWNANPPKILPNERQGSGTAYDFGSGRQFPNSYAFAVLKSNGSVVTWGDPNYGGDSSAVAGSLTSNVTAVYSTRYAFAALKTDGSVVTWGAPEFGGSFAISTLDPTPSSSSSKPATAREVFILSPAAGNLTSNVTAVYANHEAFAALKNDGSVVTWGVGITGGDSSSVAARLSSDVTTVYANREAFAALKTDGSVVTWGGGNIGGNIGYLGGDSSAVAERLSSNVAAVYSTVYAFAALKSDGSVVTWGEWASGGDSSAVAARLSSDVTAVYSTSGAFAALKSDGSVVTWGTSFYGGNSSAVAERLSSNVTAVYSTTTAFAALKSDGSVVTWGDPNNGGDSSAVAGSLNSNVTAVYSTGGAFAALKSDGSLVTWGDSSRGGNSTAVVASLTANVKAVYSNHFAFAALKSDGSVVTWGAGGLGGDSSAVAARLSSNVTAVYSNKAAFAALKSDGSVVTWGQSNLGGDSTAVTANLTSGVKAVQSVIYFQPGPSISATTGNITSTTANLLGELSSEGNSPVTARGFVYALASVSDPKIGDAGVTQLADSGSGLGSYSQLLSGLTPNTAYVFRSYVVNGEGTAYSSAEIFSTNLPPVITSDGGNTTVSLNVAENSTAVSTVSATDADAGQTITYSISGGADAARFAIGSTSGVVTFAAAPDFEAPADADANNVYQVIVAATDNGNPPKSATQTLTVTVTNAADNGILAVEQPAGTSLASGGTANFGSITIGQTNELTFTLRSLGEAALLLPSEAVITGAGASDYSLVSSVPPAVLIGGSTTLTVRFSPATSGNRLATLSIPSNDTRPGRSPYTIMLSGIGSATQTIATYANAASQVLGGWVNDGNFTIGSVGTTNPGNNWPSAESPDKLVDADSATKFLTFRNSNAGVILKPTNSNLVFNRLSLWTANDATERDPASYIIYGSTSNLAGSAGTNIPISSLTEIASGNVTMLNARRTGPTVISFANSVAYTSYVVVFPTVRNSSGTTLTQISEIQLLQGTNPPLVVAMADARGGQLQSDVFEFGAIGTHWNDFESPDLAIDGNVDTKFLMFRSTNTGLLASPQAGAARVNTLTFWTANDFPERDPATYQVFGFTNRITQTSGTLPLNATLLANGTLTLPANRKSGPVQVSFNNSTAYASYLVVFPTVKNSPSTSMTQISELQFSYNGTPDFSIPSPVLSLYENLGPQSNAAFLTGITAGLGDVGQTVSFACTNDNNSLFSAQPVITAEGTLTFTTAPNTYGNATVSVVSTDNFGRSGAPQTFRIEVAIVPLISPSASSLGDFSNVSGSQSFTVNGRGLAGPITLTAPAGFEISTDNSTFSSTLEVNKPGTIQSVYRGAFGNYTTASGNIWSAGSGGEFPNRSVFAAITSNGSVVTWGQAASGGNSTILTGGNLSSNVTAVYSNQNAFAALKADGSVVTWGGAEYGGNSTNVTGGNLSSNVTAVYSNQFAFAALKDNGSIVTWGDSSYGGNSTIWNGGNIYTSVAGSLTSNVTAVYSNGGAFAALKDNGSVVTWGQAASGGNSTILTGGNLTSNVKAVYSTGFAFAALKDNGSVVTWGDSTLGGNSTIWDGVDSFTSVSGSLTSNVTAVYSNAGAFAALKDNGSVVTWGDAASGGNSTILTGGNLTSNVKAVYSTERAFAALKTDGSVVTWGDVTYGGTGGPANIGAGFPIPATIYTRLSSTAPAGSVSGNLTLTSSGVGNQTVALSGFVSSAANPALTVSTASLNNFTAKLGSASSATAFLVGGSDLTANLTISAPAGFEISSTGEAPFASSLNLAPASGTVPSTSVYARLAATAAAGVNSGNITLASTGATSQQVAVSGTVTLPYEDWVAYWNSQSSSFTGATALGSADPDGDGLSNTTEFAFQGDPLSPTASLISVAPAGGNITVTFLARVGNGTLWTGGNATGHGLDYQIQSTGNLTLGFGTASDVLNLTPTTDQTGIQPADFPYVRWEFQAPISGEKKFYRVRALPQGDQ